MLSKELTNQLVIERYKFIQDKIKSLDNILHINIGMVIKLFIGVSSFFYGVLLVHLKQPELISLQGVIISLKLSSALFFFTSIIFLLMTVSNVFSWIGYRKDEVILLQKFGGHFTRDYPKLKNFLTWQETWFLISLVLMVVCSVLIWNFSYEISLLLLA